MLNIKEHRMLLSRKLRAAVAVAVIVLAASARSAEADAAASTLPKTLQEQITYLEGALSEGIRTRDFAMFEMAIKGFKAANITDKNLLEISILRAERDAGWTTGQA